MKHSDLKSGDSVIYCGEKAKVLYVRQNGITITYWGKGLREGQAVKRRVSVRDLTK